MDPLDNISDRPSVTEYLSVNRQIGALELAGRHYITAARLAEILGVTVRTLARWNAQRIGPPKISIGKTVLFDLAKLPEWLATRETQPTRNIRH